MQNQNIKRMPAELFCKVFGDYVPRLCVDTIVIGPNDEVKPVSFSADSFPVFKWFGEHGVVLKERDEKPGIGQWGLPGGTVFKGETFADASKRIIKSDLGLEIDIIGYAGFMEFPNEEREMDVDGKKVSIVIDSKSAVLIARAHSADIVSRKAKAKWFKGLPPMVHEYHTPFLLARGFLKS